MGDFVRKVKTVVRVGAQGNTFGSGIGSDAAPMELQIFPFSILFDTARDAGL